MATGNGGAYVPSDKIYSTLLDVRDEQRDLKTAFWLFVERVDKDNEKRDDEIDKLKSRYHAILAGLVPGLLGAIALILKGS